MTQILIAEDDLTARTILSGILKKWGYEVVMVNDGRTAWEMLQTPDCPQLVILDWMMPELDGLEVIRRVREKLVEKPPYIILLSSKDEKGDILSGLETGANDYMVKPFAHEELFARIRVGQRTLELQARLYETQQNLEHLASHDALTGILNRRAILAQLAKELSRMRREKDHEHQGELCVGFMDIDSFKQINDQYGHQTGDEVLIGFVKNLSQQIRIYDTVGRLGGDEFLLIAPGLDAKTYRNLFDRLCQTISLTPIPTNAGNLQITLSLGVTVATVESSSDQLLDRADAAMYQAKRAGGNRVAYYS